MVFQSNQHVVKARWEDVMLMARLWPLDLAAASSDFGRPTLERNHLRKFTTMFQRILLILVVVVLQDVCYAQRPNIVIAFADDWGKYASCYGVLQPGGINDLARTPNFDQLASRGVLFTRAFVNSPSCTPSRSSLFSGQYFWRTGLGGILQGAVWDSSIPAFPLLLRDSGYQIGHSAKAWSPGTPTNAPFGGAATGYNSAGIRFNDFSENVSASADQQLTRSELLAEVSGNFRAFLHTRSAGVPFCYWWGPKNTHRSWVRGSGNNLWGIDPDLLAGKLPPQFPDVPTVREDVADYLGEVQAFDAGLGELIRELESTGELDNTMIIVSGDHGMPGVPAGKCNLYDLGTQVPLAISWPSRFPANRVVSDFVCLPDIAPTILEAAGIQIPSQMTATSLFPVLTSSMSGQVTSNRTFVVTGRERHGAAARTDFLPYPQRAIRTADYLYIRNFKPDRWPMGTAPGFGSAGQMPVAAVLDTDTRAAFGDMDASPTKTWLIDVARNDTSFQPFFLNAFSLRPMEELYDLTTDPAQINNVAELAEYSNVKGQLSAQLISVLQSSNDPRVTQETPIFELPPFASEFNSPPTLNNRTITIPENRPIGSSVATIQAGDLDVNQTIAYSIVSGNFDNAFVINSATGVLTVNNPLAINFELRPQYQLVIKATDRGTIPLSDSATLTINLRNLNDVPVIGNVTVAVAENSPVGFNVVKMAAIDEDMGQGHSYSIVAGNTDQIFQIEPTSGQISVANNQPLDFETKRVVRLSIRATDNGIPPRFAKAVVTINITNVAD